MENKNITRGNLIESEKKLERKLSETVKNMGGMSFKFVPLHIAGIPDRICLLPGGRIFFAEIKTTKEKPKKLQLIMYIKLTKLGFKVYIVDKSEDIKAIENDFK